MIMSNTPAAETERLFADLLALPAEGDEHPPRANGPRAPPPIRPGCSQNLGSAEGGEPRFDPLWDLAAISRTHRGGSQDAMGHKDQIAGDLRAACATGADA